MALLKIRGKVKKFAIISPPRVSFNIEEGEEIDKTVKITPAAKGLFEIVKAVPASGKEIRVSLKETDEADKKVWILTVTNKKKTKGRIHDTIKLLTTNSLQKELSIPVYGQVKPRQVVTISPAGTLFLRGMAGGPVQVAVKIVPKKGQEVEIVEAKADRGKDISLTLTKGEGDNKEYTLVVKNIRETPGRYGDTIRLSTTNKTQPEITIPVVGRIRAPEIATIRPRRLVLFGPAGETIKGSVKIVPNGKYPFSITGVKPRDGRNIKWKLNQAEESGKKVYVLEVENLKKEKGRYYDTISLKTDCKYHPEIRISLTARID